MRDVGKRTRVDEGGRPFQSLHQVGLDGVLHQHGQRASHTQIFSGDGFAFFVRGNDHLAKAVAHICQARSSAPGSP